MENSSIPLNITNLKQLISKNFFLVILISIPSAIVTLTTLDIFGLDDWSYARYINCSINGNKGYNAKIGFKWNSNYTWTSHRKLY